MFYTLPLKTRTEYYDQDQAGFQSPGQFSYKGDVLFKFECES
jgi:hypothetical protein